MPARHSARYAGHGTSGWYCVGTLRTPSGYSTRLMQRYLRRLPRFINPPSLGADHAAQKAPAQGATLCEEEDAKQNEEERKKREKRRFYKKGIEQDRRRKLRRLHRQLHATIRTPLTEGMLILSPRRLW
jgi:hypothetical protein